MIYPRIILIYTSEYINFHSFKNFVTGYILIAICIADSDMQWIWSKVNSCPLDARICNRVKLRDESLYKKKYGSMIPIDQYSINQVDQYLPGAM
jgi:hypothetical protein